MLADTTGIVVSTASLFSLLNDIATFLCESYKRMKVWAEVSEDRRHRRIAQIGETRWWSKDQALRKVFGYFGNPEGALFIDLVTSMANMEKDSTMQLSVRVKARGYMEALLRYETIRAAQIFLRIFAQTTPLSKYLQTSGMDLLTAQRMVMGTEDNLKRFGQILKVLKNAADTFVQWANNNLQEQDGCSPRKKAKKKRKPCQVK